MPTWITGKDLRWEPPSLINLTPSHRRKDRGGTDCRTAESPASAFAGARGARSAPACRARGSGGRGRRQGSRGG